MVRVFGAARWGRLVPLWPPVGGFRIEGGGEPGAEQTAPVKHQTFRAGRGGGGGSNFGRFQRPWTVNADHNAYDLPPPPHPSKVRSVYFLIQILVNLAGTHPFTSPRDMPAISAPDAFRWPQQLAQNSVGFSKLRIGWTFDADLTQHIRRRIPTVPRLIN